MATRVQSACQRTERNQRVDESARRPAARRGGMPSQWDATTVRSRSAGAFPARAHALIGANAHAGLAAAFSEAERMCRER
jgi:hypothetical protein